MIFSFSSKCIDKIKLKKKKPVESSDICPIDEEHSVIDDLQGIVVPA